MMLFGLEKLNNLNQNQRLKSDIILKKYTTILTQKYKHDIEQQHGVNWEF